MSIVVDLPADLDSQVRAVAEAEGVDAGEVVVRLVRYAADALNQKVPPVPDLPVRGGAYVVRYEDPADVAPADLADPDLLRERVAEVEAGRTVGLDEYFDRLRARLQQKAA